MKKSVAIIGGVFVGISILLFVVAWFFIKPTDSKAEEGLFVISITNQSETTKRLQESGYIHSPLTLTIARITSFRFGEIEPGGYKISKSMDARKLINILTSEPQLKWITIPEGLRKEEIGERLEKELHWSDGELEKWLNKANLKWELLDNIESNMLWTSFINDFKDSSKLSKLLDVIKEDVPLDRALAIPYYDEINLEKLLYYLAVMRTDANAQAFFIPKRKINAPTHYFGAEKSLVPDKENWNLYTNKPIKFHIVNGTHFSIFHPGDVQNFAYVFNKQLMEYT